MDKKDQNNDQNSLFYSSIVNNSIESPNLTNNSERKIHWMDLRNYFIKIVFCAAERGIYHQRFLFHLNLREAFYLIELRSRPQGHISYRRIAYQIWQEINRVHPYFAKHIKIDTTDLL